jgi:hypothetical protein
MVFSMDGRIYLKILNVFLVIAFFASAVLIFLLFLQDKIGSLNIIQFDGQLSLPLSDKGKAMLASAIVDGFACIVLFAVAFKYRRIKKATESGFLSSMVFLSATYAGLARIFEIVYTVCGSDFIGLSKYYVLLDTTASLFFLIVTIQVFLMEVIEKHKAFTTLISAIMIAGIAVGILRLFADYLPSGDPFIYVIAGTGAGVLGLVIIVLFFICQKIFGLGRRMELGINRQAVLVIGINQQFNKPWTKLDISKILLLFMFGLEVK